MNATMERLRESLRLGPGVWSIDQLGTPIPAGHEVGHEGSYFPGAGETDGLKVEG